MYFFLIYLRINKNYRGQVKNNSCLEMIYALSEMYTYIEIVIYEMFFSLQLEFMSIFIPVTPRVSNENVWDRQRKE